MKKLPLFGAVAALALAPLAGAGPATAQQATQETGMSASAKMISADGKEIGQVTFTQTKSGVVVILAELSGLPAGAHGFHIHEKGVCDAAGKFESAGGHYTGGKSHGVNAENGPHAGDLPNVHVATDGVLKVEMFTTQLSLAEGAETPLIDADGSAVMVHGMPDDYTSDPAGMAGERLACGVIEQPT